MKIVRYVEVKKIFSISIFVFFIFGLIGTTGAQTLESFSLSRLEIHSGEEVHSFTVEMAETFRQRTQGLQYRKSLAPDHGMLFNFKKSTPVSMWMKNTYISLDILFISGQGKIINIVHDTEPLSLNYIDAVGQVKGALEVLAGTVDRLNIKVGDMVFHSIF
jgi:uncharacterized membrane protein (UPF0127 family)